MIITKETSPFMINSRTLRQVTPNERRILTEKGRILGMITFCFITFYLMYFSLRDLSRHRMPVNGRLYENKD
jgi:hypothetical protein